MNVVKNISTRLDEAGRRLSKFLRMGKDDIQECPVVAPFGIDSNPLKDMVAIYSPTGEQGKNIILGYVNAKVVELQPGELRLFSAGTSGEPQIFIYLKNDGIIEFGGNADNLVRYSQTADSVNELKDSVNDLKNLISSWVPVPNDGGAALKAALTSWVSNPLIEDISGAKIDELKTL